MDRRYFEALELQKVERYRENALKFINKMMDRSGLIESDLTPKDKADYAGNILRRSCKMVNARRQELPAFAKEVGFTKYVRKLKEALNPIKIEKYSEDEVEKYIILGRDTVQAHDILTEWNITDSEFLKMVNDHQKDGMTVYFAEQIVLQIDSVFSPRHEVPQIMDTKNALELR